MSRQKTEYPRMVSIETTNRCNAKCPFCPNSALSRDRINMSDELFEKVVEDCREFPLKAIEPFLNGEPFVDKKILPRLELIRRRLPDTKLRLYTNGYGLSPRKIDQLVGLGIDHLYVSLNTLDPDTYKEIMGLNLERTLQNMDYLTDPVRRDKVARNFTFRMTRSDDTPLSEQAAFQSYCKKRGVRPFIVGLFNYKGEISSKLPVPNFPCEHITRVDVLASGIVTLCCMDQEGEYSWGDAREDSVLNIYNNARATRLKTMHRKGKRKETEPCDKCNVFWPSLEKMPIWSKAKFAIETGMYFMRYRPSGKKGKRGI
ncbi:MAG: radical SAM protein [Deltaproteobacteria bacterium]|nr:radical SAM protein [Deltaproteobacteria bacterium]